jgi:ferredoxin
MPYVITRLCRDCLDEGCVEVCPVDCIWAPAPASAAELPAQLYIHPTDCISCGACEPECPWGAIFDDQEVPALLEQDIALNADVASRPARYQVAARPSARRGEAGRAGLPGAAAVATNRTRWGLER